MSCGYPSDCACPEGECENCEFNYDEDEDEYWSDPYLEIEEQ
jgi:hypothetical protein